MEVMVNSCIVDNKLKFKQYLLNEVL